MFAEAKYVHSPDLGLWKGAVHFAFAVALSLSQPLVNIFLAADADTRYSHQSNFVKYTPTAVRQQSPQTTWDYVHFVYSKSSAAINTNAPLSSGATQPSTIPTIVLALALCMILVLASASLVLDKGVRTASGPRSDASGSSHRPRRARRTASFSSSSGSGSSSNTGNTSRRRRPSQNPNPNPTPGPSDGASGSGQTPPANSRHFVTDAGAPPPPPPPGTSAAVASPFDKARSSPDWLFWVALLLYPLGALRIYLSRNPDVLCRCPRNTQYTARSDAMDTSSNTSAKSASGEVDSLVHETVKAVTTRVARAAAECTNTIPLPRPSTRPLPALTTPIVAAPPLQSLQVLCAALDAVAPTAQAITGVHGPSDLFAGGVLYTLVKIYALGVAMMAAIAAPMLVILRSDSIPWSRLPSAIGQLWAEHDESEDEGELPNNWIDLVFSTASFSVDPDSEERMVTSSKEAHANKQRTSAITTADIHSALNHPAMPTTKIIEPRNNLYRKPPRRKTVRDIVWNDPNAHILSVNRPEANVQTATLPGDKNVEVKVNELPANTEPTSNGVDNEDEIFVYHSKPKFTTSLTRRASVCTEIMHEEEPNTRNARARLQKAIVLGKRASSTPPAKAAVPEAQIVQDKSVETALESVTDGVAQSMWASVPEPEEESKPQQKPEPQRNPEPQPKNIPVIVNPVVRRSTRTPRSKHTKKSPAVNQAEAGPSRLRDTSTANNITAPSSGLSASMWASAPAPATTVPVPPRRAVANKPRNTSSTMRASAPEFKPRVRPTNSPPPVNVAPSGTSASMWATPSENPFDVSSRKETFLSPEDDRYGVEHVKHLQLKPADLAVQAARKCLSVSRTNPPPTNAG